MLIKRSHMLVSVLALGLAGAQGALAADTVATVNDEVITQEDVDAYVKENNMGEAAEKNRDRIIDQIVVQELVYQDAEARDLADTQAVKEQLAKARRNILVSAAVQNYLNDHPITEAELKAAYDQQLPSLKQQEFKARHILVKTEAEAKDLIAQLDDGADFAELAKEHSTGPTGKNGGSLGWFSERQMVPKFTAAVRAMQAGTYSREPVQTQFGWHVIKLEDTRQAEPPKFEQIKPQLEQLLQRQRVEQYIGDLRDEASIEIN